MCGLSQTTAELITSRTVQGIGAAMLQATSAAIITTIIPRDRQGPALGTLGILMGLGPVLGPSVGGTLISFSGWRSIFWINIPVAVAGLIGCGQLKRTVNEVLKPVHLNVTGNLLLSMSILALLSGIPVRVVYGREIELRHYQFVSGMRTTSYGVRHAGTVYCTPNY
ncbi:MFS transporter [Alicyclobacillus pomorum]|uniref:MFS transporter n=1 Tax=Alicyclobacillus pomorum TaxID=204470 RepID=UPI0039F13178